MQLQVETYTEVRTSYSYHLLTTIKKKFTLITTIMTILDNWFCIAPIIIIWFYLVNVQQAFGRQLQKIYVQGIVYVVFNESY